MVNALPPKADAPTWRWRIEPSRLREAAELRRADPNNFDSAVLTYFGLGGRDDGAIIEKMRADPEGRRIVAERIPLPPEILQPEALAQLPENTLGHTYWAHLDRAGIDPKFISTRSAKVAEQYPATAEHQFVYDRYRDSHDLWHVLTGYGLDMAGEAGIVAFTYAQLRNRGYLLIALLNALMCTKRGRPDVFRTAWRGFQHGRRTPLLLAIDWRGQLERPLDEVRREFGIELAAEYRSFDLESAPGYVPA